MIIRRFFPLLLALLLSLALMLPVAAVEEEPPLSIDDLSAQTAILMDADTGQILYENQMHRTMYPASITKIMTALLTLENRNPTDTVTAYYSALHFTHGSSHLALQDEEVLSIHDALSALMVASANDVANVLAEDMGGTQEDFAKMMTQRAHEIGAVNTNFTNAHGLPDDDHITTAYDMAIITQEAIKNPRFMDYFGIPRYTVAPTNKQEQERYLYNHHYMLREEMWPYTPEIIGGKTGYTTESGNTLVSVAEKNGRRLICVVLNCGRNETFTDTQILLDYGFSQLNTYRFHTSTTVTPLLPLTSTTGEDIGYATVALPEVITLSLLPEERTADLETTLIHPDSVEEDDATPPRLEVRLTTDKGSKKLIDMPVEYHYQLHPPPTAVEKEPGFQLGLHLPSLSSDVQTLLLLGLALGLTFLLWTRYKKTHP